MPWSDFMKSTVGQGQFGLVNVMVGEMESGDPEQEREIVTGVASYGKQLGRMMNALSMVVNRAEEPAES